MSVRCFHVCVECVKVCMLLASCFIWQSCCVLVYRSLSAHCLHAVLCKSVLFCHCSSAAGCYFAATKLFTILCASVVSVYWCSVKVLSLLAVSRFCV